MHIENFHIHLPGQREFAAALKQTLEYTEQEKGRSHGGYFSRSGWAGSMLLQLLSELQAGHGQLPAIGDRWPGLEGRYAGIARAEGDRSEGPLVLLDAEPPKGMGHSEMKAWAESLGDGARLATRSEGALLYAHLRDKLKTDRWYWLLDESQSSSSDAWSQNFDSGIQSTGRKSYEGWGCAVRRF